MNAILEVDTDYDGTEGRTCWITGLPAAGKTTIGRLLWQRLRADGLHALLLDGDAMRRILGESWGYDEAERRSLAGTYGRLCLELSRQGATVICATVSMYHDIREWNRRHLPGYFEIFVRAPLPVRHARDRKGLYATTDAGGVVRCIEFGSYFEEPRSPDLIVENDGSQSLEAIVQSIYRGFTARAR